MSNNVRGTLKYVVRHVAKAFGLAAYEVEEVLFEEAPNLSPATLVYGSGVEGERRCRRGFLGADGPAPRRLGAGGAAATRRAAAPPRDGRPRRQQRRRRRRVRRCPCYKSPKRGGARRLHFVFDVDLRTEDPPARWILRGILCLLTTKD